MDGPASLDDVSGKVARQDRKVAARGALNPQARSKQLHTMFSISLPLDPRTASEPAPARRARVGGCAASMGAAVTAAACFEECLAGCLMREGPACGPLAGGRASRFGGPGLVPLT